MAAELLNLIKGLPLQDWWSRQKTIRKLLEYPEAEYVGYLEEGIRNHEDADARNAAMEVFKELGIKAFPSLSSLLKDVDPEVRLFSVNILHEIGAGESLPLLLEAMEDPDVNVRAAAAETAGRIRDRRALAALRKALRDEPWVASAAISAIGDIGGSEALDTLYACLRLPEQQPMAILALEKSGEADSLSRLVPLMGSEAVKELVLRAVVTIAQREQVRPPAEFFSGTIPSITDMMSSSDNGLRKAALIALCWSGSGECLSSIIDAVKDPDLQEYAIGHLIETAGPAAAQVREALRGSSGQHRVILAKILSLTGEGESMLEFADDDDPEVRTEVALALGSICTEEAAGVLKRMLADPSEEVHMAAERSLRLLNRSA